MCKHQMHTNTNRLEKWNLKSIKLDGITCEARNVNDGDTKRVGEQNTCYKNKHVDMVEWARKL